MIPVIILLQQLPRLLKPNIQPLRQRLDRLTHPVVNLCPGDSADRRIFRHHRNIHQVIQFTEYAQLRELGYPRDENEPKVRIQTLDRAVEVPHNLPHRRKPLFVVHNIQQRRVIFIDDYDSLFACLLDRPVDQPLESLIYFNIFLSSAVNLFIDVQFLVQLIKQLFF